MIKSKINSSKIKGVSNVVMALVCVSALFSACTKEDDEPIDVKPVIAVSSPVDGASHISGSTVNLAFTANSVNGLKKVAVKFKSATGNESTIFDTTLTSQPSNFSFSRNYTTGSVGTETYTIVITDKRDNIETKSVNVKSISGFGTEEFGTFFHISGSKPGAFDLMRSEQRVITDADADKDLVNTNNSGIFDGSWVAKNSTLYVKANGFDYNNGTLTNAKTIYSAGSPNVAVTLPLVGEVYISKVRGTETYSVIKIIAVDALNSECGCANTGKLTFSYKKSL